MRVDEECDDYCAWEFGALFEQAPNFLGFIVDVKTVQEDHASGRDVADVGGKIIKVGHTGQLVERLTDVPGCPGEHESSSNTLQGDAEVYCLFLRGMPGDAPYVEGGCHGGEGNDDSDGQR